MDLSDEEIPKKTRVWKENIANLLFKKDICGICLKEQRELKNWNNICIIEGGGVEKSLKNIIKSTFLTNIADLLPTTAFCEECVAIVLSTYFMVKKIQSNHNILQKYFSIINEQIETGDKTQIPIEKQLMLTIDNVESLNVPNKVTKESKKVQNITQIFVCEVDNSDFEPELFSRVQNVPKYECPYCGQSYSEYEIFIQHYKEHYDKYFRCYHCGKRVQHFDNLISHRKNTHSENLLTCNLCKIILLSSKSTEHQQEHLLSSTSTEHQKEHLLSSTSTEHQKEPLLSSTSTEHQKEHLLSSTSTEHQKEPLLSSTSTEHQKENLLSSTSTEHQKEPLLSSTSTEHQKEHAKPKCHLCQISFDENDDLDKHTKQYHSIMSCPTCYKYFSNPSKLELHRCLYKCLECEEDSCQHEAFLASYREQHLAHSTEFKCFKCLVCEFQYETRSQIIRHANEKHLQLFPYLCDLCGKSFPSKPYLSNHVYKYHSDNALNHKLNALNHKLKLLSSNVVNEQPLEGITCLNKKKKMIKCLFCHKTFDVLQKLSVHIKKEHSDDAVFQCSMCPLDFPTADDLQNHIATHPKDTKHVCRECNRTFVSLNFFNTHKDRHVAKYDKVCPICFKSYTKFTIRRHIKQHKDKKQKDEDTNCTIVCEVCGDELLNENVLIKHAVKHTEVKQCSVCLENVNSALYTKHINTHMQSHKPLKECSYCSYKTRFSTCLEAHVNRHHLNRRPYKCGICDKMFLSEYTLRRHKLTHSSVRPELYCHICGRKFISKKAVILHTRLHTGETPYPCELCDKSFISASRRKQHVIRKHFEPSVECIICNKKLYTQSDLRRHIGDVHNGTTKTKKGRMDEVVIDCDNDQDVG